MIALNIIAWALLGLCLSGGVVWCAAAIRVGLGMVHRTSIREGLHLPTPNGGWPLVSIIVPAHNEQEMIEACARLLREQQYERLEIIFVLDRCTDETAARLAPHADSDPRIIVIENDQCPEGWAGKTHAMHLGVQRASGDWLLFVDADTRSDPGLVRAAVAMASDRDMDLLSLLTTLTHGHLFERIAQPAAVITLIRLFPPQRSGGQKSPRPFANGQFILIRRAMYDRIGGYAAVRDNLMEDIELARLVRNEGGGRLIAFSDGMFHASMYDSLADFKTGWKRILIGGCHRNPERLRKEAWRTLVMTAMNGLQLAALALAGLLASTGLLLLPIALLAVVLTGWVLQMAALLPLYVDQRAPLRFIPLFAVGCWIVGRIMLEAARDLEQGRPVVWAQREYVLEPRRPGESATPAVPARPEARP